MARPDYCYFGPGGAGRPGRPPSKTQPSSANEARPGPADAPAPEKRTKKLLVLPFVFLVWKFLFSLVQLKTAQNGVPIVLMMFLYEARACARASCRSTSAQLGPHFGLIRTRRGQ